MSERFAGCHGVTVVPSRLGFELGWLRERPPLEVEVELVDSVERAPGAELVWQLDEPPALGLPAITSRTWQEPGNRMWVGNTLNLSLRVDHRRKLVSVAAKNRNQQVILEALANIALPLVVQENGLLVLHAAAACREGSAVMLCAQSGSGKSSLLMGLVAAGWEALSEDQCVIDLDGAGFHRVWPGPSWVRLKQHAQLPPLVAGKEPRFEAVDKRAWDLSARMARSPARLGRLVLLEPPGGDEIVWERLTQPEIIGALRSHATWFSRPETYPRTVLPPLVKLAMSVPGFRMRIPRRADWLERGVAVLAEA